jgi:hypothetical protein
LRKDFRSGDPGVPCWIVRGVKDGVKYKRCRGAYDCGVGDLEDGAVSRDDLGGDTVRWRPGCGFRHGAVSEVIVCAC